MVLGLENKRNHCQMITSLICDDRPEVSVKGVGLFIFLERWHTALQYVVASFEFGALLEACCALQMRKTHLLHVGDVLLLA